MYDGDGFLENIEKIPFPNAFDFLAATFVMAPVRKREKIQKLILKLPDNRDFFLDSHIMI